MGFAFEMPHVSDLMAGFLFFSPAAGTAAGTASKAADDRRCVAPDAAHGGGGRQV